MNWHSLALEFKPHSGLLSCQHYQLVVSVASHQHQTVIAICSQHYGVGAELVKDDGTSSNGFHAVRVDWFEHPERTETYKQETIAQIGELKWRQEGELEFLSSDPLLIDSMKMTKFGAGAVPTKIIPLTVSADKVYNLNFYVDKLSKTKPYYIGCDVSKGVGR
jgi:hypothetical protein